MNWLHTWAGVIFGALLFAIFWMGTLTVFDREIDRWMWPESRLALTSTPHSWDAWWRKHPPATGASEWSITMPTPRQPMITITSSPAPPGQATSRSFDPESGAMLPPSRSRAGSGFIYRFHADLHIVPQILGYWIVGIAGMAMLMLCLSGVVIHRRLFADFFLLRPRARTGRLSLDLHVVAGVLALPFHIFITFTGMVVFLSVFFLPQIGGIVYQGDVARFTREWTGFYERPKAGVAASGTIASLDAMVAEAERRWGAPPSALYVSHLGDANGYVTMQRPSAHTVTRPLEGLTFDAVSGAVIHERVMKPPVRVYQFMSGFHLMRYDQWTLRWLCFVLGLAGCVLIVTGYLFWMESRRRAHERQGMAGVRIVEGLTIGGTTGIVAATMAFFVANRVMPADAAPLGVEPAVLEMWSFYAVWLATFAHAWLRRGAAWAEQCWSIAVLAAAAVVLNAVTTGDHLVRTMVTGNWVVAGMDLTLLACCVSAALTGRALRQRPGRGVVSPERPLAPAIEGQRA